MQQGWPGWHSQWWANPNPDLDLNLDLATFVKSGGFGLDLNCLDIVDLNLDLRFLRMVDLDLNIA